MNEQTMAFGLALVAFAVVAIALVAGLAPIVAQAFTLAH